MNNPKVTASFGNYYYEWADYKLKIWVNRLTESSKQSVSAEIKVKYDEPERHLHQARLTLTDPKGKKSLENSLNERTENNPNYKKVDWYAIIEYICVKTLESYREGEPIILLQELDTIPPLEYILYPLLVKNEHNILFGDGGTGKTYMADLVALLIQNNITFLNLVPQCGNVLILDWETSRETHERRANAIRKGHNFQGGLFYYRYCERSLVDEIDQIQQMVADKNISLVITDSAGMASGLDGEYHASAIRYARALRSLRTTCLSIDHIAKSEGESPFGSIYKKNIARSAFKIKHSSNPGEQDLYLALFHHKMNDGFKQKPFGYHLHFVGDERNLEKVIFDKQDVSDIPDFADSIPLKDRIAKSLGSTGAMTEEEIAEELQSSKESIRTVLYRNKNRFVKVGIKEWGLLANE